MNEALTTAVELRNAYGEAWVCIDIAEILLLYGDYDEALVHGQRAFGILTALNYPLLATMAANSVGSAFNAMNAPQEAMTHHRHARDMAQHVGYRAQEARALKAGLRLR